MNVLIPATENSHNRYARLWCERSYRLFAHVSRSVHYSSARISHTVVLHIDLGSARLYPVTAFPMTTVNPVRDAVEGVDKPKNTLGEENHCL